MILFTICDLFTMNIYDRNGRDLIDSLSLSLTLFWRVFKEEGESIM